MIRTQIQLTEEQYRRLRRLARNRGISVSEAVRRCVADRLLPEEASMSREQLVRAALAVCGKYRDPKGGRRIAADHDRHLADAYRS